MCDPKCLILISSHVSPPTPPHPQPWASAFHWVNERFPCVSQVQRYSMRCRLLFLGLSGRMFAGTCFPSDGKVEGSQPMLLVPSAEAFSLGMSPLHVQVPPDLFVPLCGNWSSGIGCRKLGSLGYCFSPSYNGCPL